MPVSQAIVAIVRLRAGYACEYCGVTETETRGTLTVDHHRPQAHGGSDAVDNLVYCCYRCNLHKSAYWSVPGDTAPLWNPRMESSAEHFVELIDGRLLALSDVGRATIAALKLNREPAVQARYKALRAGNRQELLRRLADAATAIRQMRTQKLGELEFQQEVIAIETELLQAIRLVDME